MSILVTCDSCGKEYNLKDALAGRKVRCSACDSVLTVPDLGMAIREAGPLEDLLRSSPRKQASAITTHPEAPEPGQDQDLPPVFRRDQFLLRQKHFSLHEKYEVCNARGNPILFVERPTHLAAGCVALLAGLVVLIGVGAVAAVGASELGRAGNDALSVIVGVGGMALAVVLFCVVLIALYPKRHIGFYGDRDHDELLLEVLQDRKFTPITATYTCIDPEGNCLGRFRKNYLYDFFRKHWHVYDAEGELIAVAKEDSVLLSVLRRAFGPMFGLLRTNFVIFAGDGETPLGVFNRKFTLFDRYVLDLSDDEERSFDRRLAIALGVLLDTGERR